MDQRKLRDCLGLFATGVVIACARRKNFFAKTFFAEKISTHQFFESEIFNKKVFGMEFGKNVLQRLKKLFADEFFGMTINSFASVSLDPALISFCIDNKSTNLKFFKKNRYFSINVLSQEQQGLAAAFATPKNSTKWGVEPYFFGQKGNPIFQNSLGFFECKKHRIFKMGDHHIIIGEILDFGEANDKEPLLYYSGKYVAL